MTDWVPADWPAPAQVHAGTTTRLNGVSRAPFDSCNLAGHVGDRPEAVAANRRRLSARLNLPAEPVWLQQQHGNVIISAPQGRGAPADGAYTNRPGAVCAALSADCVPLLLCSRDGAEIAALHAGWRGLCSGIISAGVAMFNAAPQHLLAWIGPHIRQAHYEVGADVIDACAARWTQTRAASAPARTGHWRLSLCQLVTAELRQLGVTDICDSKLCSYASSDLFYSWRRDGVTGRMASLIWLES